MRQLSIGDQLICGLDMALRTLTPKAHTAHRNNPAEQLDDHDLTEEQKSHAAGLMRVNHSGEVCAQALYQGQALTAKLPDTRTQMEEAAKEEVDHLAWCESRIHELGSHTSHLNPLWYGMSFGIGALAGAVSDKISLGFVAATEDQVCQHLDNHLENLPENDLKSRAIVKQMREDEAKHAETALNAGGAKFPAPIKKGMTLISKVMTEASYRI